MDKKEKDKEQIAETEEKDQKVEKKVIKLPLVIGGIVLVLAILAAGGVFLMKSLMPAADAASEETAEVVDNPENDATQATGIYYSEFDAFITVLEPSDDYRFTYLKFVPKFELSDTAVSTEMSSKLPLIEDKINAVMTDLNWDSVKSERGRERLAEKLTAKLNELLEKGSIHKTYFTTFVAQ